MGKCPGRSDFWPFCSLDHPTAPPIISQQLNIGQIRAGRHTFQTLSFKDEIKEEEEK